MYVSKSASLLTAGYLDFLRNVRWQPLIVSQDVSQAGKNRLRGEGDAVAATDQKEARVLT